MEKQLMERDWRFMLDAVYRVNSAGSVEILEREALECLDALIPSTQGTFFIAEEDERGHSVYRRAVVIGAQARFMDEFLSGDYDKDPYFRGMQLIPQTEAFRDSDLLPAGYREDCKLYKDIYGPQGIHYALRAYFVHKHKLIGNISIFNAKEDSDFDARSLAILSMLAPHIALKLGALLEEEATRKGIERRNDPASQLMAKRGLTMREQEVVLLIVSGRDDREIADALCISLSTLRKHIYNAYKKLDVNNRVQLCALVNATGTCVL